MLNLFTLYRVFRWFKGMLEYVLPSSVFFMSDQLLTLTTGCGRAAPREKGPWSAQFQALVEVAVSKNRIAAVSLPKSCWLLTHSTSFNIIQPVSDVSVFLAIFVEVMGRRADCGGNDVAWYRSCSIDSAKAAGRAASGLAGEPRLPDPCGVEGLQVAHGLHVAHGPS